MKLTIQQLFNAAPSLTHLHAQPLKGAAALHVRRLARAVQPELTVACAARDTLITDANSVDGLGKQVKPECVADFLKNPFFSEEIEIEATPLTAEDLAIATISPSQIDGLGPLFID